MQITVYTIGHSNLELERFIQILKNFNISLIFDVRSQPFSKRYPHFNKNELSSALKEAGISYQYKGNELGGRPKNLSYYINGIVDYERLNSDKEYLKAIKELISFASKIKVAIMCSEKDPIKCHRALLIGRSLKERGVNVIHILSDKETETQVDIEKHLIGEDSGQMSMFKDENLDSAYKMRSNKVAFKRSKIKYHGRSRQRK